MIDDWLTANAATDDALFQSHHKIYTVYLPLMGYRDIVIGQYTNKAIRVVSSLNAGALGDTAALVSIISDIYYVFFFLSYEPASHIGFAFFYRERGIGTGGLSGPITNIDGIGGGRENEKGGCGKPREGRKFAKLIGAKPALSALADFTGGDFAFKKLIGTEAYFS